MERPALDTLAEKVGGARTVSWRRLVRAMRRSVWPPSPYRFRARDVLLHAVEQGWVPPPLVTELQGDGMRRLRVGDVAFWWPEALGTADLTWLYAEVFFPFGDNPSSYAHPNVRPAGRWVLDGGAGEGFFSVHALRGGARRLVAIEPIGQLQGPLGQTLQEHASVPVGVVCAALSSAVGVGTLTLEHAHGATAALGPHPSGTPVKTTTIDALAEGLGLNGPGLIKLDVEGAEMDALRGARHTLQRQKPALAVAVYHGLHHARECMDIIRDANPGYTLEFRGMYGYFLPARPYMLFGW